MNSDPFDKFFRWYGEAARHSDIQEANAMNLATVGEGAKPSSRMVLLKDFDDTGFVFYTNLDSRKGNELKNNKAAALCFYWEPLGKQIRIEGFITQVSDLEADTYFASRPLKSRIGAWASKQSRPLSSQKQLLSNVAKQTARFTTQSVPRPEHWSGFRLKPDYFEFWQRGAFRLHERISYQRDDQNMWQDQLLYP